MVLGVGRWVLGVGRWALGVRHWVLGVGPCALGVGLPRGVKEAHWVEHGSVGLMLLLGGAVNGSSSSELSSIKILDGRSFCFLLPIDAFSRGKESIKRKGAYSPRHAAPTEDPILNAFEFLVWVV